MISISFPLFCEAVKLNAEGMIENPLTVSLFSNQIAAVEPVDEFSCYVYCGACKFHIALDHDAFMTRLGRGMAEHNARVRNAQMEAQAKAAAAAQLADRINSGSR